MSAAIVTLQLSLNVGKNNTTVQFSTIQKFRSAYSNVYHASASGQSGASLMAKDSKELFVTKCPTYGRWYEKFMRGCHKCMGDIVKLDRALSSSILIEVLR